MRRTYLARFAIVLTALLAACAGQPPAAAPAPPPTVSPLGEGVHTLLLLDGDVEVQRAGWQSSIPGRFGMVLRSGDLLETSEAARASVVCADLSVQPLAPGPSGVPCRSAAPVIFEGQSRVQPARAGLVDEPLVLVSPRKTRLLNLRPTVRWSGDQAGGYEVHVSGPGVSWTRSVTGVTSLEYPLEEPALAPGGDYLIEVRSGQWSTEDEPTPGRGFTLLEGEGRASVDAALARIKGLGLDEPSTRIVSARALLANELYADAYEQLQAVPQAATEPEFQLLSGDIFLAIDLPRLAEERYVAAEALAAQRGDQEAQAIAERMLGLIYRDTFGNAAEARAHLTRAKEHYQQVGDATAVADIEQLLSGL